MFRSPPIRTGSPTPMHPDDFDDFDDDDPNYDDTNLESDEYEDSKFINNNKYLGLIKKRS